MMKTNLDLNLTTPNFTLSEDNRYKIKKKLESELKCLPDHSQINLNIVKLEDTVWSFNLSMRYTRGHLATKKIETTLDKVIEVGLAQFAQDLEIHGQQARVEPFHFDHTDEYDYYTAVSSEPAKNEGHELKTLIVEDDPVSSLVLKTILKTRGCSVDYFGIPNEALKVILNQRYDLLVLDWNLPYMKGSEFLEAADILLRKNDRPGQPIRQIPVVICTSLPLDEIKLPAVTHFCFYNHWHKGLPFSSLLGTVDDLTKKVMARNRKI
ncbi:MAG: response regulator [Moraxellaceae bacterium]|nr:response regulator [Pseudobdellovibrionaceae bacterium]